MHAMRYLSANVRPDETAARRGSSPPRGQGRMAIAAGNSGRILVVDDQSVNLRVVGTLLTRQGYEVISASSGEEALQRYVETPPDLILLDMMMPGMDGFDVLAALHELGPLQVPVVFVTAAHDRDLLLRAFDAGVVDYVTKPFLPEELLARVAAHVGLKLTRDRLERVAREREELVNLVAHDLKNPLGSVLFAAELLRSGLCKAERIPRYLQMIHESADDALGYIRHYLESQSASRDRSANDENADLGETLQWLHARYEMQLEARGIRVDLRPPPAPAHVAIHPRVLRQVAENLVTNAMKYAPGSELMLAARNGAPGYWQLIVADRGPGIPPERQRELFKPFVRLHDEAKDDGLSNGLGLSLAKRIIARAGGQLWYEPRRQGGARFIIELPEAALAAN
jgi:two-component system sensor histidine kinase/response regulator